MALKGIGSRTGSLSIGTKTRLSSSSSKSVSAKSGTLIDRAPSLPGCRSVASVSSAKMTRDLAALASLLNQRKPNPAGKDVRRQVESMLLKIRSIIQPEGGEKWVHFGKLGPPGEQPEKKRRITCPHCRRRFYMQVAT